MTDMTEQEERLVAAAIAAMGQAYAPYSKFPVGAAILDEGGGIHSGANVENAAYPVGNCAEASAIAAMVMAGRGRINAIAVAGGDGKMLCTPCGACRQRQDQKPVEMKSHELSLSEPLSKNIVPTWLPQL